MAPPKKVIPIVRKGPSPEVLAKGQAALAIWRKERAAAQKKGGRFYEAWLERERIKKEQKKLTPMGAIKAFCNACVGGIRGDITECTAKQCSLFIYRPYQNGEE